MNSDNKLQIEVTPNLEGLNAKEIFEVLYSKELNSKKNILEYISITKLLKQSNVSRDQIQDTYTFIYNSIDEMGNSIKANTIMYLKNQLKSQLGKYVKEKDPKPMNHFIEFFKEAYPAKFRKKDFTWVLMDINKITEEQIWTTLAYINAWCLINNNRLIQEQKNDIIKMVEILIEKNNIKYINQVKSLSKFLNILNITIINDGNRFKVKNK